MSPEELKEIADKVGKETADKIKSGIDAAEKAINEKHAEAIKGLMTQKDFDDFKAEQLAPVNEQLKKLEDVAKEQGNKINTIVEKAAPNSKTLEQFLTEKAPEFAELRKNGKMVEFTAQQLKDAGINT